MVEVYRGCKYLLLNRVPMWVLDLCLAAEVNTQLARAAENRFTHVNSQNIAIQQMTERYGDGTTSSENVRV